MPVTDTLNRDQRPGYRGQGRGTGARKQGSGSRGQEQRLVYEHGVWGLTD